MLGIRKGNFSRELYKISGKWQHGRAHQQPGVREARHELLVTDYITCRFQKRWVVSQGGSGEFGDDEDPGDVEPVFLTQYIAVHIDFISQPNQMNRLDLISGHWDAGKFYLCIKELIQYSLQILYLGSYILSSDAKV